MTDVADEIRKAVAGTVPHRSESDEAFAKVRAECRGALLKAHFALTGGHWEWLTTDDKVVDIVDRWLHQKAGR